MAAALGAATLTSAVAGCSSGGGLTIGQATRTGTERLDAISTALVGQEQVTVPWQASSTTSAGVGCAKDDQRWVGVGTVTVKAPNTDGDSPPTRLVAALQNAGWRPGDSAGDLDQDPATVVPAVPADKDPAALRLTGTVERTPGSWHYVVDLTSDCASRS